MSVSYFQAVATKWDEMRAGFFPDAVRERAADAAGLGVGSVAADVGAGTGFVTEELLRRGARVVAVDPAPAMLAELRARFPGVETRVGDAQRLPLDDAAVDHVLSNMCLHHVERPEVAVREMARVVRAGGRVVITDLDAHGEEWLRAEHHDRWLGFDRAQVRAWFEAAGLVDVEVRDVDATCSASSCCGSERAAVGIFLAVGRKP